MTKEEIWLMVNKDKVLVEPRSGKCWWLKNGKCIREAGFMDSCGYRTVRPKQDGKRVRILIHRIIWTYEHGSIPKGWSVHHIDEDRQNNRISNLEMLKISEHRSLHMAGERNPCFGRIGSLHPMYGKFGMEHPRHRLHNISKGER